MKLQIILFFILVNYLFAFSNTQFFDNLNNEEKNFLKEHPQIIVSNEKDWAPYDYNEQGVAKGYSVDYLKLIASKLGVEFKFETDTWSNLIEKIKTKKIDIIHPISFIEKRKEYLNYTKSIIHADLSIISSDIQTEISSLNDLKLKTVAVSKGWSSTKYLKENYPKIIFKEYETSREKLEAVSLGNADAAIEYYITANHIKNRYLLNNLKIVNHIEEEDLKRSLHIAVRKDWQILSQIINKAIDTITEEEILSLDRKWINTKNNAFNFTINELEYMKSKKSIRMCVDPNWLPYEQILNNQHIGMSSDYFDIFRKIIPIPINLVKTNNWSETLSYVKNRTCDVISLAIPTPKRLEYLSFSKSYINVPLVIATDLTKPFVTRFKDVQEYKIGVVRGYAYYEILKNKYPKVNLVEVENVKDGMNKIISGEIYGFVDSLAVVGYVVQKNYLGSIKIAGEVDENFQLGVAIRSDEPLLKNIFNKTVLELKDDNHREILNKWVSVTYDKSFDSVLVWKIVLAMSIIIGFFLYRQNMLRKQNNMLINSQKILQETNEEFEHLINSTIEAIFVWKDDNCINANSEAVKLFRYEKKEDLLRLHALDIVDPLFHEQVLIKREEKVSLPYEINALRKDGTIFPVLVKVHNFILRNSEVTVFVVVDLSDIKYKEKLLTEHTKMAALGEMLGNIAHQWRQPLSVISTAASGMQVQKDMEILTDDMFNETMESIVLNTNYLSNTINDFTNFIKDNKTKNEFDLKEHVKKDLTILNSMIKTEYINIIVNIEDNIMINNFENEFSQAIINIISNSKDAFIERDIKNRFIFLDGKKVKDDVVFTIKDNANGISQKILDKIFEPYFTTKHKFQGTGVGLYMTNKIIVESMKGTIDVSNERYSYKGVSYKGAMFRLTL